MKFKFGRPYRILGRGEEVISGQRTIKQTSKLLFVSFDNRYMDRNFRDKNLYHQKLEQ